MMVAVAVDITNTTCVRESMPSNGCRDVANSNYVTCCNAAAVTATISTGFGHQFHHNPKLTSIPPIAPSQLTRLKI
jgi:hypothetical protein